MTSGHAMVQYAKCHPVVVQARARSQVSPSGICGSKVALAQVSLPVQQFSSVSIIPPIANTHSLSSSLHRAFRSHLISTPTNAHTYNFCIKTF